jgi:carbamoyl-phosphate synthase large subunit
LLCWSSGNPFDDYAVARDPGDTRFDLMTDLRLLVLSVGTRVGQNILTTLKGRRQGLLIMATSSVANEPALFDADVVYRVPPTAAEPDNFERALLDIVDRDGVDLVIPCRDDDVEFLAHLRDRRPGFAPRLLCGGGAAARVISDKWLSAEFCAQHDLPFAASLVDRSDDARKAFVARHGFPLVAKPRRGYASLGVYMLWNEAQLRRTLDQGDYIVQQFLGDPRTIADYLATVEAKGIPLHHTFQGTRHSIQALIAPDGTIAHVMCICLVSDRRRSKWVGPDTDPASQEIGARCAAVFAEAGWRGPLNIQCQRAPDGRLFIHEFNGRFTGATLARWLVGFDEVGAAVERFTGRRMPTGRAPAPAALEAFESVVGRAADPGDVATLERDGVWRRPR